MKSQNQFRLTSSRAALTARLALSLTLASSFATAWAVGPNDAAEKTATKPAPGQDTVIVIGQNEKAAALAPSQSTLEATEPQSVISEEFISKSQPKTSDFMILLQITPSAGGVPSTNGPGLGEAKTTLRGFKDGEYNITFDGVPFGDTNNPTHHSTSFFPAADIGQIVVERGPGNASNLGQASFGGTVMLSSKALSDTAGGSLEGTLGSWGTQNFVATAQTGKFGDNNAHLLATFHAIKSEGAQSNSPVGGADQLIKGDAEFFGGRLHVTALATHDYNTYYQPDATSGLTWARAAVVGRDYQFSKNPFAPDYYGYAITKKQTWFTYLRADFEVNEDIHLQDTPYYYFYNNTTSSADDITSDATGKFAPAAFTFWPTPNGTSVAPAATAAVLSPPYGAPNGAIHISGYDKGNHYAVTGNIFKANIRTPIGEVTTGIWYENASTDRRQFALDLPSKAPNFKNSGTVVPKNITYLQHSSWSQYQPFVELAWQPIPQLTVTPGAKYISFTRTVNAEVNQTSRVPTNFSKDWDATLPYLTANYRLMDNWSVYAQYAKGFLAPDLNTTYIADPTTSDFSPQTSTNYQAGTVFRTDHLTIDADVYQVDFKNKVVQLGVGQVVNGVTLTLPQFFNVGGVKYKGWEAQATYAFDFGLAIFANGSKNDTTVEDPRGGTTNNGTIAVANDGKPTNGAPQWTAAGGLIYSNGPIRASLTHKIVGQQYASLGGVNKIQPLETTGFDVSYDFGKLEVFAGVQNLGNHQDIVSISGTPPAAGAIDNRRYTFQSGRFVQVGAKVNF